jgi:hypothetical protein
LIIGAIDAIANAIPPTACFTPSSEHGMNAKASTAIRKFNWRGCAIGHNFWAGDDDRCGIG